MMKQIKIARLRYAVMLQHERMRKTCNISQLSVILIQYIIHSLRRVEKLSDEPVFEKLFIIWNVTMSRRFGGTSRINLQSRSKQETSRRQASNQVKMQLYCKVVVLLASRNSFGLSRHLSLPALGLLA